jgi:hypothetical protein
MDISVRDEKWPLKKVKASVDLIAESTKKKANEPEKTREQKRAANQQFHKKHQAQLDRDVRRLDD